MTITLANSSWTWWCQPRAVQCGTLVFVMGARDDGTRGLDVIAADGTVSRMRFMTASTPDDHVNGALVAVPGKPLLAFYQDHNLNANTYVYKDARNADAFICDFPTAASTTLNWGSNLSHTVNFSMPLADPTNNTIHLFTSLDNQFAAYARSETWAADFAAQVTNPPTIWLDVGSTFTGGTSSFGFVTYRQLDSDSTKCRVFYAAGYEGGRAVRYCEINLATGDITKSDGTVLGNLRTGLNLPLSGKEADSPLELVYQAPAGACLNYVYDILGAATPEGVFAVQDLTNPDTASTYQWCQRSSTSPITWTVEQITNTGPRFTTAPTVGYLSGAQFLSSQNVILGRNPGGGGFVNGLWVGSQWNLEKWTRQSPGAWTSTILRSDPTNPLVRAYPISGGVSHSYVYNRLTRFSAYTDYEGDLIVV